MKRNPVKELNKVCKSIQNLRANDFVALEMTLDGKPAYFLDSRNPTEDIHLQLGELDKDTIEAIKKLWVLLHTKERNSRYKTI